MPPGYGAPPPPKKSKMGWLIGGGCGCVALLGCLIGGIAYFVMSMGPGEEVASTQVNLGQPYSVSYPQSGSQRYQAWMEVDVSYSSGYSLAGNALLADAAGAFGEYNIEENGSGNPVRERSDSTTRMNWTSTNLNGSGSTSGTVSLFPIPARTDGTTVTVSGTLNAPPGTTGTVRVFIAKRD